MSRNEFEIENHFINHNCNFILIRHQIVSSAYQWSNFRPSDGSKTINLTYF